MIVFIIKMCARKMYVTLTSTLVVVKKHSSSSYLSFPNRKYINMPTHLHIRRQKQNAHIHICVFRLFANIMHYNACNEKTEWILWLTYKMLHPAFFCLSKIIFSLNAEQSCSQCFWFCGYWVLKLLIGSMHFKLFTFCVSERRKYVNILYVHVHS